MANHKNLGVGDIHVPYQWAYTDATARTGATGFVSSDLGKLARQLDDNSLWQLTATTPTWKSVDAGSGGGVPTSRAINTTNGLQGGGDLTTDRTLSPVYGSSANTVCQGNDSRLSDARQPTGHAASHGFASTDPIATGLSSGILYGCLLSVNALDDTKFDITAGAVIIVDAHTTPGAPTISFCEVAAQVGVTDPEIANSTETYVSIDANGEFVFSTTEPTAVARRQTAYIGWTSHPDNATLYDAYTEPFLSIDVGSQLDDFLQAFGAFNISGNEYGPHDTTLEIERSAGVTFDNGSNYRNEPRQPHYLPTNAESPVAELWYFHRDPGDPSGWNNNLPLKTVVDPDYYDDGSGTLASVPTGKFTIQVITYYAPWGVTDIQYGQVVYDTLADAVAAISAPVVMNPWNADFDTLRCWMVVKQGATDLTNATQAAFVTASRFGMIQAVGSGGSGGEANTASNVGTGGVGLYHNKAGVDLEFKNIKAASTKVTVTDTPATHTVDLDVVPANIAHQDLSGAGTNTHSQIDTHVGSTSNPHSVTKTQVGLGNVTDDAQLKRAANDIASFTEKATPVAADLILIEDSAASNAKKRVQLGNLPGGVDTTAIHKATSAEISALTEKTTPVSADVLLMEDSAASFGKKKVTVGNVLAQQVFGQSFQTAASSARSTTTSLTYQTKVTLTTPALTGTFRIGWTAALDHNSVSSSAKLRCYNQTDGAVIGAEQLKEFQDALNIETLSGFGYVTFTGSAKTFTLDYCCATANTTGIQAAVLEFWRVS